MYICAAHLSVYPDKVMSGGGPGWQLHITDEITLTTSSLMTEIELHNSCRNKYSKMTVRALCMYIIYLTLFSFRNISGR
jgi:hypothetical protein